ncbi:TolC family protein, partial [bacterium]|nr:TolC family protein [bacterium]
MANRFLIIILVCIVSGCAHFEPKPILPEQTLLDFESRSLSNSGLQSFLQANDLATDASPVLWNLDALTAAALYYHPDLDVARAQWGIEKAGTITAGERPNPTVGFSPEFNSSSPAAITPWILGFNLDIPIETFGKRGYRIAQANNNSESARLEIASVAWQVRSHVRQSMIELYLAETMADLLKKQEAIQSDVVHLLALQLDAGAVSPSEVTQGR